MYALSRGSLRERVTTRNTKRQSFPYAERHVVNEPGVRFDYMGPMKTGPVTQIRSDSIDKNNHVFYIQL